VSLAVPHRESANVGVVEASPGDVRVSRTSHRAKVWRDAGDSRVPVVAEEASGVRSVVTVKSHRDVVPPVFCAPVEPRTVTEDGSVVDDGRVHHECVVEDALGRSETELYKVLSPDLDLGVAFDRPTGRCDGIREELWIREVSVVQHLGLESIVLILDDKLDCLGL